MLIPIVCHVYWHHAWELHLTWTCSQWRVKKKSQKPNILLTLLFSWLILYRRQTSLQRRRGSHFSGHSLWLSFWLTLSRNLLIWSTDNSVQFRLLMTLPLANGLASLTWHKLVCVVWANNTKRPSVRDINVASVKLQTQTTITVVNLLVYPTVAWQELYTCQWSDHRSWSFVYRCNYGTRFGPNLPEVAHCD